MFLLIGLIEKKFSPIIIGKHITKIWAMSSNIGENLITETITARECQTIWYNIDREKLYRLV